jgi:hypothetical protein
MKPPLPRATLWGLALSQAPLIWDAASRVLGLIRGRIALSRDPEGKGRGPHEITLPELAAEVEQVQRALRAVDDSQLEQIKLLQQVVEQNRAVALAMRALTIRYRIVLGAAALLLAADAALAWKLFART